MILERRERQISHGLQVLGMNKDFFDVAFGLVS